MDEKVEVKHIILTIGNDDVIMSPAQASELCKILSEMFNKNTDHPYPVPYYVPFREWPYDRWIITCESNTANLVLK